MYIDKRAGRGYVRRARSRLPAAGAWLCLGVAIALTSGCSRDAPQPAPPSAAASAAPAASPLAEARERATQLDAQRSAFRAVHGRLPVEGVESQFVAFFDGALLRHIEERLDYGEYGRGSGKYYLDTTGKLFFYVADDERSVPDAEREGQNGAMDHVRYALVFDSGGRMIASEKSVNDKVEPLQDVEIDGVVKHFGALREAAQAELSSNR